MSIQSDFSYRAWFKQNDPNLHMYDEFEREFGNEDFLSIIIHNPEGILNTETLSFLQKASENLYYAHNVMKVDSLTDYDLVQGTKDEIVMSPLISEADIKELTPERIKAILYEAKENNLLKNYLINATGTTTVIYLRVKPVFDGDHGYEKTFADAKSIVNKLELPSGTDVYFSGAVSVIQALGGQVNLDLAKIIPVLLVIVVLTTFYLFRSVYLTLIPVLLIFFTVAIAFAIGTLFDVSFNAITSMAPHILIAICMSDSIHVLSRFLQHYSKHHDRKAALEHTIKKNLKPTFLTTCTTAVGFLSLSFTEIAPIYELGIIAGAGTVMAWVFTFTLIPFLLLRINIPTTYKEPEKLKALFGTRFLRTIGRFSTPIILIAVMMSIAGFYLANKTEVNSQTAKMLNENHEVRQGIRIMKKELGGFSGIEVVVRDRGEGLSQLLKDTERIQEWIESRAWATKAVSIVDTVKQLNMALNDGLESENKIPNDNARNAEILFLYEMMSSASNTFWISPGRKKTRINVIWVTNGSDEGNQFINEIEDQIAVMGLNAGVDGKTYLLKGINKYLVKVFVRSMVVAVSIVFFIMLIYLKSFYLACLSMIPNLVPIAIGLGIMHLMGLYIDFSVVMVASVCLGIAIDDTIHFLFYFSKRAKTQAELEKQILQVLNTTGRALITTSIILMVSFSTFLLGDLRLNDNFGLLTVVIIFIALICDLVLLPVTMMKLHHFRRPKEIQSS
jgi:predicted RND superfamily exporter protein